MMSDEQNLTSRLKQIPADLLALLERKLELLGLKIADSIAESVSSVAVKAAGGLLVVTGSLFLLIGSALFLNELFNSNWLGFVVQGAFFVVIGIISIVWKNSFWKLKIRSSIMNSLLTSMKLAEQKQLSQPAESPALEQK